MPRDFNRSDRVAQMISRSLAGILRDEVKDPRVSNLTITDVEVSKDLSQAKVFVTSTLSEGAEPNEKIDALDRASGFIRRELAHRTELRHCPNLVFVYDDSIERGAKMSALIDQALNSTK